MTLSKKFEKIIQESNKSGDIKPVITELKRLKERNFSTFISTAFSVVKAIRSPFKEIFRPSNEELEIFKKENPSKPKIVRKIRVDVLKDIIDNRYTDLNGLFSYILLNSGRRTAEILDNEYKVKNHKFFIEINKQQNRGGEKYLLLVEILLDNDVNGLVKDIEKLRNGIKNENIATFKRHFNSYLKRMYNITPHSLRSIYATYIYKLRNPDNISMGYLINTILNHKRDSGSATRYDSIELPDLKYDLFKDDYKKYNVPELKEIVKAKGLDVKRLNKNDLLNILQRENCFKR